MNRLAKIIFAMISVLVILNPAVAGDKYWPGPYRSGVLVFKVEPAQKVEIPTQGTERYGQPEIDRYMDDIGAYLVEPMFPDCLPPTKSGTDISLIYALYFDEALPVVDLCNSLAEIEGIQFAEPWIIDKVIEYNDPLSQYQYGLRLVDSEEAHEISTGDPDVIIAIPDTGVDHDHQDLLGNRWFNLGEDINDNGRYDNDDRNGEDDDNNGFVDDFYGWDYYSGDNNPDDPAGHGTHCAGIASAVTNNETGVASVGYSCSIMPIRVGVIDAITHGYQGIQYAVRNGAKVISCSWGGPQYSEWAENIINYAHDNDVIVLGGSGNGNTDDQFYPAAYEHVVAVSATDQNDRKANFSNYGDWIDVSAPGVAIRSTYPGNRYVNMQGTSMACPFAASVAGLLRSYFPNKDVDEIWELLLEGADDIGRDDMGSGRVNALQSLQLGMRPNIEIEDFEITVDDDNNGRLDLDETAEFAVTLYNGQDGETAEDIMVMLITDDPSINIVNPIVEFPDIEPGEEYTNVDDPFVVEVDRDAYAHTTYFEVRVTASPGNFELITEFEIVVGHPDILIVDDDGGDDFEKYYLHSLDQIQRGWVKWDVDELLSPDPGVLQDHKMVIWFTGDTEPGLDEFDRWQLESAFEGGANIMLTGQYIGDDNNDQTASILLNYFGARHDEDRVSATTVEGISDNRPIPPESRMALLGAGGAQNGRTSPSTMITALGSDSLLLYHRQSNGEDVVGGLAGVYRYDEDDDYRTIYLGFAFEGVSGAGDTTPRETIIEQLYTWFTGDFDDVPFESGTLATFNLAPAYPNPFNGQVNLNFTLPQRSDYRLWITDLHGREIAALGSGVAAAGNHSTVWKASNLPSGVYVASLKIAGSKPLEQKLILLK